MVARDGGGYSNTALIAQVSKANMEHERCHLSVPHGKVKERPILL